MRCGCRHLPSAALTSLVSGLTCTDAETWTIFLIEFTFLDSLSVVKSEGNTFLIRASSVVWLDLFYNGILIGGIFFWERKEILKYIFHTVTSFWHSPWKRNRLMSQTDDIASERSSPRIRPNDDPEVAFEMPCYTKSNLNYRSEVLSACIWSETQENKSQRLYVFIH